MVKGSDEGPLFGLEMPIFSLGPYMLERARKLSVIKALIPFMGLHPQELLLSRAHP